MKQAPFVSTKPAISRRAFLRGAGIALSLPFLDAMRPTFAGAIAAKVESATTPGGKARRFFGICNNLGVLPQNFFPKTTGADYELSPYLQMLKEHKNDFTVFSGVSHPDVDGGHPADTCSSRRCLTHDVAASEHDFARTIHWRTIGT